MGVPGEDLPGSWPATAFVAWYNGHPDFQDLSFDLDCERVVVVGNGNVAVDVARMLALTAGELAPTDTTDEAIEAIVGAGVREILVLGRRGPVQAAFTNPELVELTELAGADLLVDPADLELDPSSEAALADDSMAQRNLAVLRETAATAPSGKPRAIASAFAPRRSPYSATGVSRRSRSSATSWSTTGGAACVRPTDDREVIPCGAVLRSRRLPRRPAPGRARSTSARGDAERRRAGARRDGAPLPGVYCTGWIKRGPSGVIGTNKKDATETVDKLLEDVRSGGLPLEAGRPPPTSTRCSPSVASTSSRRPGGRRSTQPSAHAGSSSAARASSSPAGPSCSLQRGASHLHS